MAETKPGWRRLRFDEMVTSAGATRKARGWTADEAGVDRYVGLEHLDANSPTIRRWGSPEDVGENSDLRPFEAGDVILARRGIEQRKVGFATFDGVASGHALVFRARPGVLLPEFLPYFLLSDAFMGRADQFSAGSLSKTVNLTTLLRLEFALPPLEEQRRLAMGLNAAVAAVEATERGLWSLDSVESALLRDQFGLYSTTNAVQMVPLCAVAHIQSGVAKGRVAEPGTTVEAPYLRVANVKDGALDLSEVLQITVERSALGKYILRPGDVLMTEGGDLDKLGRGTVWQGEIEGCVHQNHVFAVRPDSSKLDSWYLAALARSPFGRGYFQRCAKRTSNLASVNKRELGALPVPAVGLRQQKQFVEAWAGIRSSQAQLRARADFGRRVLTGLLSNLTEA